MLRRKALDRLREWRSNAENKSMIVTGARQVGKTYIVREFGKEYASYIEINFLENPRAKVIFDGPLDADTLLRGIRLYVSDVRVIPGETLLFLDEIQECPAAITALKFLAGDRRVDTIASGSALGMAYHRGTSYPVGYVTYLDMYSLDFEEFLWAMGVDEDIIEAVRVHGQELTPVEPALHQVFMRYLRQYLVLGGMPEVVDIFTVNQDYAAADSAQRRIYRDYLADIARFAAPAEKLKAEMCYRSIPAQLMKNNHKFQYSVVEKKGTARKFESSLDWLESSYMVIPVRNVGYVEYPLQLHEMEDSLRIYPSDPGLLVCTFDYSLKRALLADRNEETTSDIVLKTAKGGLYEALAADLLRKGGHRKLHFFRNEAGTAEVEFLIEGAQGVVPVEVKAGRTRSRSLDNLLKKDDIHHGFKLADQNVGVDGKKITLPLYMAMWI